MIVLDANILLYAYDEASDQHAKARAWVEEVLSGTDPVGLPWQTIMAFARIVTNPRLSGKRFTPSGAAQMSRCGSIASSMNSRARGRALLFDLGLDA